MTDFFYMEGDFRLSNPEKHICYTTNEVNLFETPTTREYLSLFYKGKWKFR